MREPARLREHVTALRDSAYLWDRGVSKKEQCVESLPIISFDYFPHVPYHRLILPYLSDHPCDLCRFSSNPETARGTVSASFIYLKLQDYFSYQKWRSWCASHSPGNFPLATRHSRTARLLGLSMCTNPRLYESQPRSCHLGTALPKSKKNQFNYTRIGNAMAGNIRKYACIIID